MNSYIYIVIIIIFAIYIFNLKKEPFQSNIKFCVIVTTYNPGVYFLEKCLKSIENQIYKNYDVCILDDASNKDEIKTKDLIKEYCKKNNWKYVFKKDNIGPLGGRIGAIEKLDPDDETVIVSIDGDDELYDNHVFTLLNNYYTNDDNWITFGNDVDQYPDKKISKPKIKCKGFKFNKITENNMFRKTQWIYSHCLLYTSPSPRDGLLSRMPSSA